MKDWFRGDLKDKQCASHTIAIVYTYRYYFFVGIKQFIRKAREVRVVLEVINKLLTSKSVNTEYIDLLLGQ